MSLTITGLALDIIGACLLARGILNSDHDNIVDDAYVTPASGTLQFYGALRIRARLVDRKWTRYGLMLLITGFALQGLDQITYERAYYPILWIVLLIVAVVIFLVDYLLHHRDSINCSAELANRIYNNNPPTSGITGISPAVVPTYALLIRYGESMIHKPVTTQMKRYWAAVHHRWSSKHQ